MLKDHALFMGDAVLSSLKAVRLLILNEPVFLPKQEWRITDGKASGAYGWSVWATGRQGLTPGPYALRVLDLSYQHDKEDMFSQ